MDSGPERYDDGLWLETGATNLLPNPSFEVSNSWAVTSGTTATRVTSEAYVDTASLEVVTANAAPGEYVFLRTAGSLGYTGVARLFVGSFWIMGAGEVQATVSAFYTDTSIDTSVATSPITLTGTWQEVVVPTLTLNPAKTVDFMWILVQTTTQQGITFYLDAMQLEEDFATSYTDGDQGDGYSWNGAAHDSVSTRATAAASIDPTGILDSLTGSLAFRYTRKLDTGTLEPILECGENNAGCDHLQMFIDSDTLWVAWDSEGALPVTIDTGQTIAVDTEYFIYTYWDDLVFGISIDNGTPIVSTREVPTGDWGSNPLTLEAA